MYKVESIVTHTLFFVAKCPICLELIAVSVCSTSCQSFKCHLLCRESTTIGSYLLYNPFLQNLILTVKLISELAYASTAKDEADLSKTSNRGLIGPKWTRPGHPYWETSQLSFTSHQCATGVDCLKSHLSLWTKLPDCTYNLHVL